MSDTLEIDLEEFTRLLLSNKNEQLDFMDFADELLRDFMHQEPGEFVPLANHHEQWYETVSDNENSGIICARGHLKTTFTLVYLAWNMLYKKNFRALYVSGTLDQAHDKLEQFEELCMRSWRLKPLIKNDSDLGGGWRRGAKYFTNGSRVHGASIGKALEGPHVHLIIMDDIIQEFPNLPDDKVISYIKRVVMPVRLPGGKIILIGTQKRVGDATDWVMESKDWGTLRHPAVKDDGTPLWPEYWTLEKLEKERDMMGSRAFESEYMLNPLDPMSTVIPWEVLESCLETGEEFQEKPPGWDVVMGVDLAVGIDQHNDQTAYVVLAYDKKTGMRKVIHSWCGTVREEGAGWLQKQVDNIVHLNDKFKPLKIMIETNGYQRLVAHTAKQLTNLPIEGHNTGTEKHHTAIGVPGIALHMERGLYSIPYGDKVSKASQPGTRNLVEGLSRLTWGLNGRLEGHTPDAVVALWMCELGIKDLGNRTVFLKSDMHDIFKSQDPKKMKEPIKQKNRLKFVKL